MPHALRQPPARRGRRQPCGERAWHDVTWIFALTFAFGLGLAGLGGALGAEILGFDSTFPLKFMIYFLIVVTVGGISSITGPFLASLLLGIGDVAGKYYVPTLGSLVIYTIMIVVLIWRPQGLFFRAASAEAPVMLPPPIAIRVATEWLSARARWQPLEVAFWLVVFAAISCSRTATHPHRDRLARPVRTFARSDPRLRGHPLAGTCRFLAWAPM